MEKTISDLQNEIVRLESENAELRDKVAFAINSTMEFRDEITQLENQINSTAQTEPALEAYNAKLGQAKWAKLDESLSLCEAEPNPRSKTNKRFEGDIGLTSKTYTPEAGFIILNKGAGTRTKVWVGLDGKERREFF